MKILCLNHKQKYCGIYQYGYRMFHILQKCIKNTYIYSEVETVEEYLNTVNNNKDCEIILYNYFPVTMPWLNIYVIPQGIINIGLLHDNNPHFFSIIIDVASISSRVPRPIYQNIDKLLENYSPSTESIKDFIDYKEDNAPIFGSFGFGNMNKGFQEIVTLVNKQYDRAIIKFIIGIQTIHTIKNVQPVIDICMKKNIKPSIKLMITTEYFSELDIIKFLSTNTMNILLYSNKDGPISSTPDYALSVKVPLGISKYSGFNHIYSPCICLEETSIEECMKVSVQYCDKFREEYSTENIISFFDQLIEKDFISNSQVCQDVFAYKILGRKKNGTYLDIGAGDCIAQGNNTLRLADIGWTGIGVDIQDCCIWGWNNIRKHPYICDDITNINWDKYINEYSILQSSIDYLSFDVDDATILAANNFPWDKIRAKVITIEHDSYRVGDNVKNILRNILSSKGYELLCSDVIIGENKAIFEDWWVDPKQVDMSIAEKYRCDKVKGNDIVTRY